MKPLDMTTRQAVTGATGTARTDEMVCASHGAPWFCVQTVPNQEPRAFLGISQAKFRAHFPQIVVKQRRYGRVESIIRPLFPSYVLVAFDPATDPWGLILRVPGVRRVLAALNGSPTPLRAGEIERLQKLGRAGDGVIDESAVPFDVGTELLVLKGPFTSFTGICEWSDGERVRLLMSMFGRSVPATMDQGDVEQVEEA